MKSWSQEELDTLDDLYESEPWETITAALPKRSRDAIRRKAADLGLRKPEESASTERAASGLLGSKVSLMRRCIKLTLRHPIEAAWRGLAQTS